jgi:hypothetical protein
VKGRGQSLGSRLRSRHARKRAERGGKGCERLGRSFGPGGNVEVGPVDIHEIVLAVLVGDAGDIRIDAVPLGVVSVRGPGMLRLLSRLGKVANSVSSNFWSESLR